MQGSTNDASLYFIIIFIITKKTVPISIIVMGYIHQTKEI